MAHYTVAVIGAGLVGSAAAKYLAEELREQVVLIGPPEPAEGEKALVYASHYDAARVQRLIGKDAVWTRLNVESLQAYPALEAETGIRFHEGVGCLYVSPHGQDDYLAQAAENAAGFGLGFEDFTTAQAMASALPEYNFPEGSQGLLEVNGAGMIYPRELVRAQQAAFQKRGGVYLAETVLDRKFIGQAHRLQLSDGTDLTADRVLVACGSFTNFHGLLPRPLDIQLKGESVVLAEVSEQEAERLKHLPALLYERFADDLDGIYLTRPLLYPDGKTYLKMGLNLSEDRYFETLEQVQAWFEDTAHTEALIPKMRTALQQILPRVAFVRFVAKHCLIHRTPSGHPCIGPAGEPSLSVVAGCNGYSAMCSDALGRLAAHQTLHDCLAEGWDRVWFAPAYKA